MTHAACCLLHFLAAQRSASVYTRIESLTMQGAITEATLLGLVECPEPDGFSVAVFDWLFLRLTEKGREVVAEGRQAIEVVS